MSEGIKLFAIRGQTGPQLGRLSKHTNQSSGACLQPCELWETGQWGGFLKETHWDKLSHVVGTLRDSTTKFSKEQAMDHKEPERPAKQEEDFREEASEASQNGAEEEEQLINMESNFQRTIWIMWKDNWYWQVTWCRRAWAGLMRSVCSSTDLTLNHWLNPTPVLVS